MDKEHPVSRRGILMAGIGSVGAVASSSAAGAANLLSAAMPKVRCSDLLPHEFRARLKQRPIAYLPIGTIEWHGEHLPLGSDAIQAEELMIACARQLGGVVMPPIHVGPDRSRLMEDGSSLIGMDYAQSTIPPRRLEGSCYWISEGLFNILIDAILAQVKRAGFRAVFADGHGPSRRSWVEGLAEREVRFGLRLFGVTEEVRNAWKSQVDHAAHNETSQMLHYRPDLVDLTQLPEDRSVWPQGVGGKDPRDATADYGKGCMLESIEVVRRIFEAAGV